MSLQPIDRRVAKHHKKVDARKSVKLVIRNNKQIMFRILPIFIVAIKNSANLDMVCSKKRNANEGWMSWE
jgi:hypothetical protein